jgi:NitT/TauT family transport system substrate-binding protein
MKKLSLVFIIATAILVSGCTALETKKELSPVKVQLKWENQAQFAGNYVAEEKGFYKDNGIDITEMAPFDFTTYPIEAVENKEVDFAITGADELLTAKSKGEADNVVAIAVVYKINPVSLYSLKESGIETPQDFVGKTVGIERATDGTEINVGILYKAMMNKLGIDLNKVDEVTIGFDANELLAGETDVSSGYIINEPYGVIEAGKEVNTILVADYGVNIYADIIITNKDTIENNPELVEGFLKATLDGWQYAIENEEEAVDIVLKYAPDRTKEHEAYMLQQSIPLIHTGNSPLGMMKDEDWQTSLNILSEFGNLENEVDLNDVYTLEFLNSIYGNN